LNIFYLHDDPWECAKQHCDKHVVKMVIEYAQLLSTAHRMIDGVEYEGRTQTGRRVRRWSLPGQADENVIYKASHINHPSAQWARSNDNNYIWLLELWYALSYEYEHRYGREHLTFTKLKDVLNRVPANMSEGDFVRPPPAMPDYCKCTDVIDSYRTYYINEKARFAKWTNRETPEWFEIACQHTCSKIQTPMKSGKKQFLLKSENYFSQKTRTSQQSSSQQDSSLELA